MKNRRKKELGNSGGTMGDNRAIANEVGAIGNRNKKRPHDLDHHGTPPLSSPIRRFVGNATRICQLNVEGLTKVKADIIAKMMGERSVDVLVLQETHATSLSQLTIPGYILVSSQFHSKYGLAMYVKNGLTDMVTLLSLDLDCFSIGIRFGKLNIVNTYKPPSESWSPQVLPVLEHPTIYLGDYNSHHTMWGYRTDDKNGFHLINWASNNNIELVYDAKSSGTFHSARWNRNTTPDLCFVSTNLDGLPIPVTCQVLNKFPRSQHSPIVSEVGLSFPLVKTPPLPRWNLRKADWEMFRNTVEKTIKRIPPNTDNYDRFVGLLKSAARVSIPRGYREEYIPCWNKRCEELLREYEQNGDSDIALELVNELDEARNERWISTVTEIDFRHSSRKGWNLIRRLKEGYVSTTNLQQMSPDRIALHVQSVSRVNADKKKSKKISKDLKHIKSEYHGNSGLARCVEIGELKEALRVTKRHKAAGIDGILPEFLIELGPLAQKWLTDFFSEIITTGKIPSVWKEAKMIAILKPGKSPDEAKNYRPISLLCTTYKLLERVLLTRLTPVIESVLPIEQAGFRSGRSCCDQVLALTSFVEAGFQRRKKTGAVFIDLTSAYDTVWKKGLMFKLAGIVKCNAILNLIDNMISDRKFRVILGNKCSGVRTLQNGLPQGSVLAPILFNVYIHDIPVTLSKKFMYADDIAILCQDSSFACIQDVLNEDMRVLEQYFSAWYLKPSVEKTVHSCFHLSNIHSNRELEITFCNGQVKYDPKPKYLGIVLDRSLNYRTHLEHAKGKLTARNNIIQKLTGTSWGCSADTLRTSALALVYSVAEYCAPVWGRSSHTKIVDTQLNETMRIITGTCRSTPLAWLPVLANIPPPHIRRQNATLEIYEKIVSQPMLPVNDEINSPPNQRLKSRKPFWNEGQILKKNDFEITRAWQMEWLTAEVKNQNLVRDPVQKLPGYQLPRRLWTILNRMRTGQGRCAYLLHKWNYVSDPNCECGGVQTMNHIINDCPVFGLDGGIEKLHSVDEGAVKWLKELKLLL